MSNDRDDNDWANLDWGIAVETALCAVAFLLGFARVSGVVTAIGLALGFASRHAVRWPKRLAYLRAKQVSVAPIKTIAIALGIDVIGSLALYASGALLRDFLS